MSAFTNNADTGVQMSRLSITQAIKLSGISRTQFYGRYIKEGLISVSEHNGKRYIDSSEVLRVFGELKADSPVDKKEQIESHAGLQLQIELAVQKEQIKHLTEQLTESKEREKQYFEHIKLLESPKRKSNFVSRWWRGL